MATATQFPSNTEKPARQIFVVSDEILAHRHVGEIEALTADYQIQFSAAGSLADHLRRVLACATVRQRILETACLSLLDQVDIDDPTLARVERYRTAAERTVYKCIKQLNELLQNEPNSKPAPKPQLISDSDKTKPKPTMAELRALYPNRDRNELARMLAGVPVRR